MNRASLASGWIGILILSACGGPHQTVREKANARDVVSATAALTAGKAMVVASLTAENLDFYRRALIVLPIYRAADKNNDPTVLRSSSGQPTPQGGGKDDFPRLKGKPF